MHKMVISLKIEKYYKAQCTVNSCAIIKYQLGLLKFIVKFKFVLKTTQLVWGGI